ncbi:ribonuclease H-like domain-containing protein [Tanacetum coccineum]
MHPLPRTSPALFSRFHDVKNAFLHGHLSETVYMHKPPGFVDSSHPDCVCHLQRPLYALKQAPRVWFQRFASFVTHIDDIILTASSATLLQHIIALLHSDFAMIYLGSLNYFFGISAQRSASRLFLSQSKFTEEILKRAHMQNCNPCRTPDDTESKLVCLYMHDHRDPHFTALKHILCYVQGTIVYGLQLYVSFTVQLTTYIDVDWTSCPRQYRSVANVVAETAWLQNLFLELHASLSTATIVYCDNVSAVYLSTNPVQH